MKQFRLVVWALCVVAAGTAAAYASDRPQAGATNAVFPNYSREDETKSCLFGYGTENSSILDCVARDEKVRATLSKAWPDIDESFRKDCVARLATRRLNSYFYLDRCISSLRKDAAASE